MARIYPGYVVDMAKRELVYNPTDPSAEWCIVCKLGNFPSADGYSIESAYALIRPLDGGGWEVIYDKKFPLTVDSIVKAFVWEAKIKFEEYIEFGCLSIREIKDLLKNKPPLLRTSVRNSPANKLCCKCGKGAAVGLSSTSNSSTNRIVRHFCRDCLATGEPGKKGRICHVCRNNYRDGWAEKFYAETRDADQHEFRIHPACVKDLDNYLPEPIEERRPLRQMVITPAEAAKCISDKLPDWLNNALSAENLGSRS